MLKNFVALTMAAMILEEGDITDITATTEEGKNVSSKV